MLTQLTIHNFAIIECLIVDFQSGMTVITGETGAGKSIAIDALELCLGQRAETSMIRGGAERADICAQFSLHDTPSAELWLANNSFDVQGECFLRRVISHDGRSRAFINGTAVPLVQLKELGQLLIQIHGQHAHQLLLKPEQQRQLLDAYHSDHELLQAMRTDYQAWQQAKIALKEHQQLAAERQAKEQLLSYQLRELREFSPQEGEYQQIDDEYKKLSHSGQREELSQQLMQLLAEDEQNNILMLLHQATMQMDTLFSLDPQLQNLVTLLESATIQLSELHDELRYYAQSIDSNLEQLSQLEERLARYVSLARKNHVSPEDLADYHQQLENDYQQLAADDDKSSMLQQAIEKAALKANKTAERLSNQRSTCAKELALKITDYIHQLAMPHGRCDILVHYDANRMTREGCDQIEFVVTTNPGQPLASLAKVVSGGELSRIALAIQVITAERMALPALIFDEVDVGISGAVALTVGKLLRALASLTQVICVTHLPQVAGCGHHHFFVNKITDGVQTNTEMVILGQEARLHELARLLGGDKITANTLANAKELLVR